MSREIAADFGHTLQTRVDQPHTISRHQLRPAAELSGIELSRLAGRDVTGLAEQLQQQALELGQRLQTQQIDLDRRQADFNAQVARVESELRLARLLCAEREHELHEQLRAKVIEIESRPALNPAAVEQILRIDPTSAEMLSAPDLTRNDKSDLWDRRLAELESSERQLQAQISQLDYDRRKLGQQRAAMLEGAAQKDAEVQLARQDARRQLEEGLERLRRWSDDLGRRKTAVENLHQDAMRMVREALETRLGTEQLWGEIVGTVSETEMTQRLAALRCKLMDQFHLAGQRIDDQKHELESLKQELVEHEKALRSEREELRGWLARRHTEIEQQAGTLRNREYELQQQANDFSRLQHEWVQQRHEYEQQLRRLRRLVAPGAVRELDDVR